MKKILKKLAAVLMAFVMVFSMTPIASAAVASDLPADMADHAILRALAYTGYDVQRQKDDGTLYQPGSYAGAAPASVRSNISYGLNRSGKETVADSSTVTGFAPDIARFEKDGLCCASFVTYFLCNYLPNIEGSDTQFITDEINATGMNSQAVITWRTAMDRLVTKGKMEKIGTSSANVDRTKLTPGDVIIFGNASNANVHVAIYSGTYKGQDFIIHVGTPRGPEITLVTNMAAAGDKSSTPNAYYHFPEDIRIFENTGHIEVYKKDTNGKNLAGAKFVATNNESGRIYVIGPTESNGYAITDDELPFGTYTVKETVFPVGFHAYGQTEWTVTLDATNKGIVTINAVNEVDEGAVRITKVSEDGKVEGVKFTITGNGINQTVTTEKNGDVTVEGLKPGTYQIVEHSEDKYVPQEAHSITVVPNQTTTVSFSNTLKRGSLKVTKTSEDGLVAGIKFRLYGTSLSGREVNVFATTDRNGIAIFPDILISGDTPYTLEEVDTEEKYIVPASQTVTIEWNKSMNKSVHNTLKRGSLTVTKTSEDGLVEGVRFRLHGTSLSGTAVDEYATTDRTGKATFSNILIGSNYTLEEVNIQNRYIVPASQTAAIEWDKVTNKSFHNVLKRGSLTVTKTSEDGLVAGMKFHLFGTSLSGAAVDEYATTDRTGKATFSNILIGSNYTLEEVNIQNRYIVPAGQNAVIEWDKVTNKSFHNVLKRGSLTVTKTSEDGLVAGMRFHLFGTSLSGAKVDEYATADASGAAVFNNILISGTTPYTIEEVDTEIRYVIPANQTAPILWNEVTNRSFTNTLKKFTVSVTKRDAETGTAQGNATLAGAKYGIYKGGELVDIYTTDENGQFVTKEYICGENWAIKELEPSEGYLLDTTVYHVGAEARRYTLEHNSTANAVTEQVSKGKIAIIKHTDNGATQIETPEKGAAFEIYLKSAGSYEDAKAAERDRLICDENGFAETKSLPYGVYTVKQTDGWDGRELMKPFDVFIAQDGEIYRYLINNAFFEGYVKIIKVDAETGKAIPYAGAGFQIYDPDGNLVTMTFTYPTPTVVDTFYTGADGSLVTPEKLPYGKGFSIVEVQAPYGYVLDSDPVYFDVTQDNAAEDNSVTVVKVERPDVPQKGTITITKTGEVFSSVTESDGIYQPVYEVKGLAGAVYAVTAAEDIVTPDGTLRYAKGDVVAEITTGPDGTAVTEPLYLGKFEIRETTAPDGMVLNGESHNVELVYAGQDVTITETAATFYNERQKAEISLSKVMEQDERFDIGNDGEILSVQFGLFAAEELTAADGSVIPSDGLLEIVSCDENGRAAFRTDVPVGAKLYVKELAVDSRYLLSDEKYPVTFDYAGQEIAVVEILANGGEAIKNRLAYGTIKGLKIDRETTETIAGALFGLFRPDEIRLTEETAILTATSQEDGIFTFETVPVGSWVICELAPAEGFLPSPTLHHVQVDADEQVIEITVINSRVPEIGTTATVGNEKEICATEIFTLLDVVAYQHLIPGKEYTMKGVLMDKATGKPLLINGEEIHAETVFTPEQPEGIAVVEFTFDSKTIKTDTEIVVFESLYDGCKELALHADLEDENQTVRVKVPDIGTSADVDGKKEIYATESITLTDRVSYKNLTPGKEYAIKGVLMDKATGEPLLINGEEVHAETVFTPDTSEGEAIVEFTFDSRAVHEDTKIVVFETLYREGVEIAAHADLGDENQTVAVKIPKICTNASIDGKKDGVASGNVTLTDIVTYENLTPGKEYTVKGILMDKATGKPFLVNGEEVHAETVFTPDAPEGEVIVEFTFDGTAIKTDTEIVVFETLYREGVEIAVHADLEDGNQTVTVTPVPDKPDIPHKPDIPQTGDSSRLGFWVGLGAIGLGGVIACGIIAVKRKKDDDE